MKYFSGIYFLPKSTCKKKRWFFFLPPWFGSEIGMFEEENYFPLKNVTDAANLVAKNVFLWLSEMYSLKLIIGLQVGSLKSA